MRNLTAVVLLAAAVSPSWQDPVKVSGAKTKAVGRGKRHPWEGVYRLKRRVVGGVEPPQPTRGYIAITGRHLFLQLVAPGVEDEHPLVHAAVREWRQVGGVMHTSARLDLHSTGAGRIVLQPRGKQEARTVELVQGGLIVRQGREDYLEFERIE